jgi:CAAX protease family protein
MSTGRSPLSFFIVVFVLSVPFWFLGAASSRQVLPGVPMSSFMWICPVTAAAILLHREKGSAGVIELLSRLFDYRRITAKAWYAAVFLLMPGVTILAYTLMRLVGRPLPLPQFPGLEAPGLFLALFIPALCEELGWSGYATDPMQERWSALGAAVLIGIVWALWHAVPLLQAHRSADWIAWWSLYTIASRVLIVWIYNNTGASVFAAALYHDVMNLCWQLFPIHGSHWDPRIIGLIVTLAAAIVTIIWGPRKLTRHGAQTAAVQS